MKTYVKVLLLALAVLLVDLDDDFKRVKRETISRIRWISPRITPKLYNQTPVRARD